MYSPHVYIMQTAPRNVYKKWGSFQTYQLKRLIQLFFQRGKKWTWFLYRTHSKGLPGMLEWCLCTSPVKGTSKAYQKQLPCSQMPHRLLFWHSTSVLPPYTIKTPLVLAVMVINLAERRLAVKFTELWTQDQVTFLLKRSSIGPLNGNWHSHWIPKQTN